jgi:hypothetical protein
MSVCQHTDIFFVCNTKKWQEKGQNVEWHKIRR